MTLTKIPLKAGIDKDDAELTAEGSWADGNNVRFVRGGAEKIGGFEKLIPNQLSGKARGMVSWARNNGDPHLAIGTHTKLYAISSEILHDITPSGFTAGNEYGSAAFGFGVGAFGESTWGTPRDEAIIIAPLTWSLANWGENLLAVPRGGGLYEWSTSSSSTAVLISTGNGYAENAPTQNTAMFVTPERFVVLLGTQEYGTGNFDPTLVRWCSQEANDEWAQLSTNLAGEYKLSSGSRIVAGTVSRLQNLIWTDTSLYSMRYLGDTEFIFGFDLIGTNCGLAGPLAFAEKDGVAYWMTPNGQFYMYDGNSPRAIPCPVRRYVFDTIVRGQYDLLCCGLNSEFGEVWWWYPTDSTSPELARYVAYNVSEDAWFIGDVPRTSWVDKSTFSKPIGVSPDGYVYIHETGVDADGAALNARIRAAPFDVGDGDKIMAIHRIVPDLELEGTVDVRLETRRWPQGPIEADKTRTFTTSMNTIDIRAQGRQAAIEISADAVGDWFRLGDLRIDFTEAGRR